MQLVQGLRLIESRRGRGAVRGLLPAAFLVSFSVLTAGCCTTASTTTASPVAPASSSATLPILPPALRQQIIDHVNAYLTEVLCYEAGRDVYSQFLAVASRNNDALSTYTRSGDKQAPCTTFNRVSAIRYRAPDVETAVYDVLNEQMGHPLYLRSTVLALWVFATGALANPPKNQPVERTSIETETLLHDYFWRVPTLAGSVLASIASRLQCTDCTLEASAPKMPSTQQLQDALAAMSRGREDATGSTVYGIEALQPAYGDLDPNVVVAISRAARGSLVSTPSLENVLKVLASMGLSPENRAASDTAAPRQR